MLARSTPEVPPRHVRHAQEGEVKNYVRWSRAFGDGELESLLDACAGAERALKSGADEQAEMVRLITRVCGVR